jgi:hypothetical protein
VQENRNTATRAAYCSEAGQHLADTLRRMKVTQCKIPAVRSPLWALYDREWGFLICSEVQKSPSFTLKSDYDTTI